MTAKVKAEILNQAELSRRLKEVQLKRAEMDFEKEHNRLVYRSTVEREMLKNAAEVRTIFINVPSRIRQALRLTLDQQSAMEAVVDAVMAENLNRRDDEEQPAKPKRIRRRPASAR
jgi:hypothetical protein